MPAFYLSQRRRILNQLGNSQPLVALNDVQVNSLVPQKVSSFDIDEAEKLLIRFAPALARLFPELERTAGVIESPLVRADRLASLVDQKIIERLWVKLDSELPLTGSIKARGGIYEVLKFAESIALKAGRLSVESDYTLFANQEMRKAMGAHRVVVGSTGNLGLSIGTIAKALGMKAEIHMSNDAKLWKMQKLKQLGAHVVEHRGDYSVAVENARINAAQDEFAYFVDDETSMDLFLGYATAARRLRDQLVQENIDVTPQSPLIVFLPCGVGGAPGGITYGLKQIFGKNVHCIFVEPTQSPCFLLRALSPKDSEATVYDLGLSNKTIADGLAVPKASETAYDIVANDVFAYATVDDQEMTEWVSAAHRLDQIRLEPSAASGFAALRNSVSLNLGFDADSSPTYLVWTTGGKLIPDDEFSKYCEIS